MSVGLELRVPFLDHRFVEAAVSLPGRWKRPDPRPKPLLLDAVGPRLPSQAQRRVKRGFTFPWDPWLRGPMRSAASRVLADRERWSALGFEPTAPSSLWERFERRDPRVGALQIMALWTLGEYVVRNAITGMTM
jgi:asparagine synthase (glutamine-hydrolysing)